MQPNLTRNNLTVSEFISALNKTNSTTSIPYQMVEEPEDERVSRSLVFLIILYSISFVIFIVSFQVILKQAIVNFKFRNKNGLSSNLSQGQLFKGLFFVCLFVTSLSWDLPTFLMVISFSIFTYYLAKLTIEIEKENKTGENSKENYFPQLRDGLLNKNDDNRNSPTKLGNSIKSSTKYANNYSKLRVHLLIPFVVLFNTLALLSFIFILISYFKEVNEGADQKLDESQDWWEANQYFNYSKSIKGLTGLIFMILGITILNYGTKLETAVSNSIQKQQPSQVKDLNGLDIRILTITILLSMVFLCRALVDSLFAWTLLKTNLHYPQLSLILIMFTEVAPSVIITTIIKKNQELLQQQLIAQNGQIYSGQRRSKSPRKIVRSPYLGGVDMSEKLLTYQHIQYYSGMKKTTLGLKKKQDISSDKKKLNSDSSDEDSMFGSFNPNLNTKDGEVHSHNKLQSSRIGRIGSIDTLSRFTNKTGSYKGLLLLEKAPDENLLLQVQKVNIDLSDQRKLRDGSANRRFNNIQNNKNVVQELPNESIYTQKSQKGENSDESDSEDQDESENETTQKLVQSPSQLQIQLIQQRQQV
ncbi:UNKNOWN [Stylonychia lemnae]|uniref:Transmembrane protein n=1 Tax=Stylonychia lemnae TaxID=5949 RepID=A0A078AG73_STYLE|nr:UNKNOWN [Stylonychia lemnae]|eukprot:CDW80487.1 UNKNOWN [Stylonychia lemnae]